MERMRQSSYISHRRFARRRRETTEFLPSLAVRCRWLAREGRFSGDVRPDAADFKWELVASARLRRESTGALIAWRSRSTPGEMFCRGAQRTYGRCESSPHDGQVPVARMPRSFRRLLCDFADSANRSGPKSVWSSNSMSFWCIVMRIYASPSQIYELADNGFGRHHILPLESVIRGKEKFYFSPNYSGLAIFFSDLVK
jgi:hypothetical protein